MSEARVLPLLIWADRILAGAEQGPPLRFETLAESQEAPAPYTAMSPDPYGPGDDGLRQLLLRSLTEEVGVDRLDAEGYIARLRPTFQELEAQEHWVTAPLSDEELEQLHVSLHRVLDRLAQEAPELVRADIARWPEDLAVQADRALLAVGYLLAWQPFSPAMHFLWASNKGALSRLGELTAATLDNPDLDTLHPAFVCLQQRVHHFDSLLYGVLEFVADNRIGESDDEEDLDDDR